MAIAILGLLLIASTNLQPTLASISFCNATVTPTTFSSGAVIDFNFTIENSDTNDILWIQILRPNSGLVIYDGAAAGWNVLANASTATFTGGSLAGNSSTLNAQLTVQTPNPGNPPGSWTVLVSDQSSGASPLSCSGDLNASLESDRDTTPPVISGIKLTSLSSTSVTISWTTNEMASGSVHYGLTVDYDQESEWENDPLLVHNMVVKSLSPNSGYHFSIEADDEIGNAAFSPDNTFLTPSPGQSSDNLTIPTFSQSGSGSVPNLNTSVPLTPGKEKVPPTIAISTSLQGSYPASPEFKGTATDNDILAKIEYSLDDGKNWRVADQVAGLGSRRVTFSFTPTVTEDGNYLVRARAIDAALNTAVTEPQTLVIDRLPPVIGSHVLSLGSQVIVPSDTGQITATAGVDENITVDIAGGPTSVTVTKANNNQTITDESFASLAHSADTGLWRGIVAFPNVGDYDLRVNATDGAGNTRDRVIGHVTVVGSVVVADDRGQPIKGAEMKIFAFDKTAGQWAVWDGKPYGEANPQKTNKFGSLRFFLPPGRYYEEVTAVGYRQAISRIFELAKPSPLIDGVLLTRNIRLGVGSFSFSLPLRLPASFTRQPPVLAAGSGGNELVGKALEEFQLTRTDGTVIKATQLRGKPTLVTFLASWSPTYTEQLPALAELQANSDINILPIFTLEPLARIQATLELAGQKLVAAADPDGITISALQPGTTPTSYFVDRHGVVKAVRVGVLSKEALLQKLLEDN